MNKTFKEIYKQEQQLQIGVAGCLGYKLNPNLLNKINKREEFVPVLAHINLLKMGKTLPKSDKILKVQEELQALQNQRMLAKMTEQASKKNPQLQKTEEQKSLIIKMMETKINEYNYIVDHKHIIDRTSDKTRKILHIHKSQLQKVLQKIKNTKNQLNTLDINNQIAVNKQMAHLYRTYHQKMDRKIENGLDNYKIKTLIPDTKTALFSRQKEFGTNMRLNGNIAKESLFQTVQNSKSHRKINFDQKSNLYTEGDAQVSQIDALYFENIGQQKEKRKRKFSSNMGFLTERISKTINKDTLLGSRPKIQRQINEPFVEKKDAAKFRQMQRTLRSNSDALELMKSKVDEVRNNSHIFKMIQRKKKKRTGDVADKLDSFRSQQQQSKEQIQLWREDTYRSIREKNLKLEQEKEGIFADLLKKKHNKFNKIGGGNKMIVKYDELQAARGLLQGQANKKKRIKASTLKSDHSLLYERTQRSKVSSLMSPRQYNSEFQYLQEQIDDEHYERMCKNQKINLLLKKK